MCSLLCEEDIDGASLNGRSPLNLNIQELKRWLSCRKGAKVTGTKRALAERVQNYIAGELDKNLVDPDNGQNIARKRQRLGLDISCSSVSVVDNTYPEISMFPPSVAAWKKLADGRLILPEFSLANIVEYFITRKVCDGQQADDFKHLNNRSYPLFKAGHIQRIKLVKGNDGNIYLNAVCLPEMRKDREYKIQVVLSSSGKIIFAQDGCPAGKGPRGSYKHIAAFCYALEEFVRLGFTRTFQSCTARLQTWNQPRPKKLQPRAIYEISFQKAEFGKVKNKNLKPFPSEYNAIPSRGRRDVANATTKLASLCKLLPKPCGFLKVLSRDHIDLKHVNPSSSPPPPTPPSTPTNLQTVQLSPSPEPVLALNPPSTKSAAVMSTVNADLRPSLTLTPPSTPTTHHTVPLPPPPKTVLMLNPPSTQSAAVMSTVNADLRRSLILTPPSIATTSTKNLLLVSTTTHIPTYPDHRLEVPIKLPIVDNDVKVTAIPDCLTQAQKELYKNKVEIELAKATEIEGLTQEQSGNDEWFKHRQCRLTASNFGAVLKRKKEDCSLFLERMISKPKNLNVSSLKYGRDNEDAVANYFVKYQERHGHPGVKVFPCGLVINPKFSWLGASPDRIVFDPTSDPPIGILEVKCIESGKGKTPLETFKDKREPENGKKKSFCLMKHKDKLQLDRKHNYYHQVQGQCGVTGSKWCDFILMTDLTLGDEGVHIERIHFDKNWHKEPFMKLTNFYFSNLLPKLACD